MNLPHPENPAPQDTPSPPPPVPAPVEPPGAGVTEEQVWAALRRCYDPEIPVNIVDLGLVYDVILQGNRVTVKMTLTAPGCPLSGHIANDVQDKLLALEGLEEADVEMVWDPPWHQSMITAEGRRILGIE